MIALAQSNLATLLGRQFPSTTTVESDGAILKEPTIAAARIGELTTRTDDDTGELTMDSGHGITTGDRLDVYWATGYRYGMTVGTVAGDVVPIDGGTGDPLPIVSTAITAAVPVEEEFLVTGDDVQAIALYADQNGVIVLAESDDSESLAQNVGSAAGGDQSWVWTPAVGANPVAGEAIAKVFFSHRSSAASAVMRAACLFE